MSGSLIATSTKDRKVHVLDPRLPNDSAAVSVTLAHDGSKGGRVCWVQPSGNNSAANVLLTCGFSRNGERQMRLWDSRQMDRAYQTIGVDRGGGMLFPFMDNDTGMLYTVGKGR